jgi:hypothetical protein
MWEKSEYNISHLEIQFIYRALRIHKLPQQIKLHTESRYSLLHAIFHIVYTYLGPNKIMCYDQTLD